MIIRATIAASRAVRVAAERHFAAVVRIGVAVAESWGAAAEHAGGAATAGGSVRERADVAAASAVRDGVDARFAAVVGVPVAVAPADCAVGHALAVDAIVAAVHFQALVAAPSTRGGRAELRFASERLVVAVRPAGGAARDDALAVAADAAAVGKVTGPAAPTAVENVR